ncbi:MAG: hypothetical protein JXL84_17955 [Deltaproteobacteria bacterium]|nr:hypothetical protein [Deltaproteobacteria bacterium]
MKEREKPVDGFLFLPPGLAAWFRTFVSEREFEGTIPWTPLAKPLHQATFALVTSAGISLRSQTAFDMEREKGEPTWGDPTYRAIPRGTTERDVEVSHLHIHTKYILEDINVILPLSRMAELEEEMVIGRLAPTSYSFYGFQFQGMGFLETAIAPMSVTMKEEGVDAVLLTPACPFCCPSVGLAARYLEERGFSTIVVTPTPEFHKVVGIPRSAAIEYPFGRPLGHAGDSREQREVLLAAFDVLNTSRGPGRIRHLPFTWPEEPRKTDWHPPEMSPLVRLFLDDIKKARAREAAPAN